MARFRTDRVKEHTFLPAYLDDGGTVVDLGMNQGDFARTIHERYGSLVVGVEANPVLAGKIPHCKNAAISSRSGWTKFRIDKENSEASAIVPMSTPISGSVVQVPTVSLKTVFEELVTTRRVDLLKVDIEGAELDMIETTQGDVLRRCNQITVEFHEQGARVELVLTLMARQGFRAIDFSNGHRTDVLFTNVQVIPLSVFAVAALTLRKYHDGVLRHLRRRLGGA